MLTQDDKIQLEKFQKYYHEIEEDFAQMLAINPKLKLHFDNNGQAFTDGQEITVDPALMEIFADNSIINEAIAMLSWPQNIISCKEDALYIIEHAQLIHECLHQLYTDFPLPAYSDPLATSNNKRKILATIANIIEDSYIEAIGATKYTNIKFFLQFFRTCISIVNNKNVAPITTPQTDKLKLLNDYMNYFISYKLYPMDIIPTPPAAIQEYIIKTKPLFNQATMTAEPKERYKYVQKIFDILRPLIPEDFDERIEQNNYNNRLPGSNSHNANKTSHASQEGQAQTPSSPLFPIKQDTDDETSSNQTLPDPTEAPLGDNLFNDLEENTSSPASFSEQMAEKNQETEMQEALAEFQEALSKVSEAIEQAEQEALNNNDQTQCIRIGGDEFKDFSAHKNIIVEENHPMPNKNLKHRYTHLYNELKSNIDYYNGCFLQMLQTNRTVKEAGYRFGSGISHKKLGDPKKRFWYRNVNEADTPDLAVLVLIDGSGSMGGEKRENATKAALILHEVLGKQGINHAIVEHRAHFDKNSMETNILIDFNAKPDDKYNILNIRSDNVNRDGLSLLWAERYIAKENNETKLIIIISDGQPNHNDYYGPAAKEDTHNIVKKIERHNISVIGIALEENENNVCYEDLKTIYPNLINCPNPKSLTRKLLEIIKKVL